MSRQARRQSILLTIFLLLVLFFVSAFRMGIVHGISMMPTFHNGQLVLMRRRGWFNPPLQRFQVVLLKQGRNIIIKRIFALPGDVIHSTFPDVKDQAFRTGLADYYEQKTIQTPHGPKIQLSVPKGFLVVLGDNLPVSEDSRVFGPVPERDVLGVVVGATLPPYLHRLGKPGYLSPNG